MIEQLRTIDDRVGLPDFASSGGILKFRISDLRRNMDSDLDRGRSTKFLDETGGSLQPQDPMSSECAAPSPQRKTAWALSDVFKFYTVKFKTLKRQPEITTPTSYQPKLLAQKSLPDSRETYRVSCQSEMSPFLRLFACPQWRLISKRDDDSKMCVSCSVFRCSCLSVRASVQRQSEERTA